MKNKKITNNQEIALFFGALISFNNGLKLHHWDVTGKGNYAQHIAIDQALDSLLDITDRLVETSFALNGELDIHVPETILPEDIVKNTSDFFDTVGNARELFDEEFTQAILDDLQESIQQLLYRLLKTRDVAVE